MKKKFLIAFLILISQSLQAQRKLEVDAFSKFNNGLIGVRKGSMAGFIDTSTFLKIGFNLDMGPFEKQGMDYALRKNSYPVFSEGLCMVYDIKTKNYGYIDTSGKWVINPLYYQANDFSEGYALVRSYDNGKGTWLFIDKTGIVKLTIANDLIPISTKLKMGFISVENKTYAGYYGYVNIDKSKSILPCMFNGVGEFTNDSLAKVCRPNQYNELKWGYIDLKGNEKIEAKYSSKPEDFHSGYAIISTRDRKYGYINTKGEVVIPPDLVYALNFEGDFAIVQTESDLLKSQVRIINKKGNEVKVVTDYRVENGFHEGFALVKGKLSGKYNYMTYNGAVLLKNDVDFLENFDNGFAGFEISVNDKTSGTYKRYKGMLNNKGHVIFILTKSEF
jgi:hypothetical protein